MSSRRKNASKLRVALLFLFILCSILSLLPFHLISHVSNSTPYLDDSKHKASETASALSFHRPINHITIVTPNLTSAKEWYTRAFSCAEIHRNVRTAAKGAWYNILNQFQLHVLEKPSSDVAGCDALGQHIGLELGDVGKIRDELYRKNVSATLVPEDENGTQVVFISDEEAGGGCMTWEFTHVNKTHAFQNGFVRSNTTQQANMTNIDLNRDSMSTVEGSNHTDVHFKFAISSGNPIATAAGYACLQLGGSAADASIASASVLSVVEPFNGGLGGDFMGLVYDPTRDSVSVLNGSGKAPMNAGRLPSEIRKIPNRGPFSALSLPGTAAAWCRLHNSFGRLPWELVLQPAIMLASEGFMVSNRTAQVWEQAAEEVLAQPDLNDISKIEFLRMFVPAGSGGVRMTPRAGERFQNPALGLTLRKLAEGGCEWFYDEAVREMTAHVESRGGVSMISKSSSSNETVVEHASWEVPLSSVNKKGESMYEVLTVGSNSQGAAALLILNILDGMSNQTSPATEAAYDARTQLTHYHLSAKRIIYRDFFRKRFTKETVNDRKYIESAKQEMRESFTKRSAIKMNVSEQNQDTEGFVIRDSNGLVITALQSLALPFGSGIVVPSLGLPLHGRGYGFSADAIQENGYRASNRPWTTLAPYIVKRDGKFWLAASVKGGDRQPYAFTQIFLNLVEFQQSLQNAVAQPRFRDRSHISNMESINFDSPPYLASDARKVEDDDMLSLLDSLESLGYNCTRYLPQQIEDSGFGVAQILIEEGAFAETDPMSASKAVSLKAISDLTRKPGLALTGAQTSLVSSIRIPVGPDVVHPQDLNRLSAPLRRFFVHHLHTIPSDSIKQLAIEGQDNFEDMKLEITSLNVGITSFSASHRHLSNMDSSRRNKLYLQTRVNFTSVLSTSKIDGFAVQRDDYPNITDGSLLFPIGSVPKIGTDDFLYGLCEDNSGLFRYLKPIVPEYIPSLIDSRDPEWKFLLRETPAKDQNLKANMTFSSTGLSFPTVVKPARQGTAGSGVKIINTPEELYLESARRDAVNESFVLQEAIEGKSEYTIHFMAYYGKLLSVECFRSEFKSQQNLYVKGSKGYGAAPPYNKGRSYLGCQNELESVKVTAEIARGTLYNGIGCLQYKKVQGTGPIKIIELNPRMCGGIASGKYWHKVARMFAKWIYANEQGVDVL